MGVHVAVFICLFIFKLCMSSLKHCETMWFVLDNVLLSPWPAIIFWQFFHNTLHDLCLVDVQKLKPSLWCSGWISRVMLSVLKDGQSAFWHLTADIPITQWCSKCWMSSVGYGLTCAALIKFRPPAHHTVHLVQAQKGWYSYSASYFCTSKSFVLSWQYTSLHTSFIFCTIFLCYQ
jgi:hypothetical protein